MTACMSVIDGAINPALALLPAAMDSAPARVMLLAIGLQESRLTARCQIIAGGGRGPARGLWQFEAGGGVRGVMTHPTSRFWAAQVCASRSVPFIQSVVWAALETDDALAAAFARLLLFTDPRRLPTVGDPDAAWACYLRLWRPGKPHPATWPALYAEAVASIQQP